MPIRRCRELGGNAHIHTQTLAFEVQFTIYSTQQRLTFMFLYCGMLLIIFMLLYQKIGSAAVLKLFNRSHKSKNAEQGRSVLRRRLIVSCSLSEFRGFLIRGFSVAISLKLRMQSLRGRKGVSRET